MVQIFDTQEEKDQQHTLYKGQKALLKTCSNVVSVFLVHYIMNAHRMH